jgi:alpha-2-macroglobulin
MKRTPNLLLLATIALWISGITIYLARQEMPTGWLQGTIIAEETGRALPNAEIQLHLISFSPQGTADFVIHPRPDGSFSSRRLPAGKYQIQASSSAHHLAPTTIDLEEGKVRQLDLELAPVAPFFELNFHQHVFTPKETPQVTGHGFLRREAIDFQLYRVDPEALTRKHHGSLRDLLGVEDSWEKLNLEAPGLTPAQQFSAPITQRDIEGVFHQRFSLPVLAPGLYLLVGRADAETQVDWLMVTRLGLVVKHWGHQALAYVTDLQSGEPVAGAKVVFALQGNSQVSGLTDARGLYQGKVPGDASSEFFAQASYQGSLAYLDSWLEMNEETPARVYLYTDRPVYRPGDEVNFKGLLRHYQEPGYTVPAGKPVAVKVWDHRDTLVFRGEYTTNNFGSYHGKLTLNDEAATGYYRIVSSIDGQEQESGFKVAEYRKPEYNVTVTPEKKRYVTGETLKAQVTAEYYFGAPVAGGEVSYTIYRSPYWYYPEDEGYDAEYQGDSGDYGGGYYGEMVEEGGARTDEQGKVAIAFSPKPPNSEDPYVEAEDYTYTIEATVTDPSQKSVTADSSVLVTQGEFSLSVETERYIAAPGESAVFNILARDYDDKPVAGVKVALTAEQETWQRDISAYKRQAKGAVVTDSQGKAVYHFTPPTPGYFKVQAQANDRKGNTVKGLGYIWVTAGDSYDFGMPYPDLDIVPDKKNYAAGDKMVLLLNTGKTGATALVAVEGPRLYSYQLVKLTGKSTRLEIPLLPEYAPNFFVSAVFVKDKNFISAEKRIVVSVKERALQIALTPDKTKYHPGDKATYRLAVKDWQGKPVQAELSLGVVDEAIYAIQPETTEPILQFFYPPRENQVQTDYSFPQIYLDADKESVGLAVRRKFRDTAYWNPAILTDAAGKAEVSFTLPDNLTTWRATVRGATLATAVGEATAKTVVSKALLVRLEAPRFMVQKDQLTLSALVHNYSKENQDLQVWLKAPGLKFIDGQPEDKFSFSLAPEEVRKQTWQVAVSNLGAKEITVYVKAKSGLSDAMALTLPALPHGRERVEWRSGEVTDKVTERLTVRADAVPGASELRIRLAPSLASVVLGALDYLAQYPYGCTEQTMSAFLPDVIVARALRELQLPNPRLEKELPKMVQKGFDRLYNYQHDDGGWGWWEYDDSELWMSSYVLFGLLTAKENGFDVNEPALQKGLDWLAQETKKQKVENYSADEAYALYVLALAQKGALVDPPLSKIYQRVNSLDNYRLALLLATLEARGRTREAKVIANHLWEKAERGDLIYWRGQGQDWWDNGNIEITTWAFKSLVALDANDSRLPKVARWLVLNRQGNHWYSTRDTAFALYALTDYLKHTQELNPDFEAQVTLNGKTRSRHFGKENLFDPEVEWVFKGGELKGGDNLLEIAKPGAGSLYYTLSFTQYVGKDEMNKLVTGSGISVERNYYRLINEKDPRTGVITTSPSPNPVRDFPAGESILVRLEIRAPKEFAYFVIEDPLPAGCEGIDQGRLDLWDWNYWFSDREMRDEKAVFFARKIPAGVSTIEYYLRPQIPGDYHVMPTQAYAMYNPDLRGSGEEDRVKIK